MRILSSNAKFSAGRPLLPVPVYNFFRPQWRLPIAPIVSGLWPIENFWRLPTFLAHVYCAKTAGWIRIPLGTEIGLVPGDIVLDRDPAHTHPRKGAQQPPPPLFGPLLWPASPQARILPINRIIDQAVRGRRFSWQSNRNYHPSSGVIYFFSYRPTVFSFISIHN